MSEELINSTSDYTASTRRYRSIPIDSMQVSNTINHVNEYKHIWKNGSGSNTKVDFSELEQYCSQSHVRWILTRFESSGWGEATKVANYHKIRRILKWKFMSNHSTGSMEFSTSLCSDFIHANYLSMVANGVGLSGKPMSGHTLGHLGSVLTSILTKFGLKPIPKEKRNLKTTSASLDSDNYSLKELKAVGKVLLKNRKLLLKQHNHDDSTENEKRVIFDRLIANAVFLTIYYLGSGQTETINMYVDDEFQMSHLGGNRISITGIKGRNNYSKNAYIFTPRRSCKVFFDSHLTFSKEQATKLGLSKHYLFKKANGESPNASNLSLYVKYLRKTNSDFEKLYQSNPSFRLNTSLLKSTIKQKMESEKGRHHAAMATRNAASTFDTAKYSKTTAKEAKRQLAIGVTTLQHLGEDPSGGTKVAIAQTKKFVGEVLTEEEYQLLKDRQTTEEIERIDNGGFCKGENTPQRKEFKKNLQKNPLLSTHDKAQMGCGFVVKCFSCSNFGAVDDSNDIWKLLSFEMRLNEAMALHKDLSHFFTNYGEVKESISKLKLRFKKANLQVAENRLKRECHPLWDDYSIMDIIRG